LAARKEEDAELARLKFRKARIEQKKRARAAEGAAEAIVTLGNEAAGPGSDLDASEGSQEEVVDASDRKLLGGVNHAKHKRRRTRDVLDEGLELGGSDARTGWVGGLEAQEAQARQLLAARGL
jgi:hypothetical protein